MYYIRIQIVYGFHHLKMLFNLSVQLVVMLFSFDVRYIELIAYGVRSILWWLSLHAIGEGTRLSSCNVSPNGQPAELFDCDRSNSPAAIGYILFTPNGSGGTGTWDAVFHHAFRSTTLQTYC
jgi:hypothetical protein